MSNLAATNPKRLARSVSSLSGVGDRRAERLAQAGIATVEDLLHYYPRRYLDRSTINRIETLQPDMHATIVGRIESCGIKKGRRSRFIANVFDGSGYVECVWFAQPKMWQRVFKPDELIAFHGKISWYGGPQMVHPEYDKLPDEAALENRNLLNTGIIIPLYPSSEALKQVNLDSRGFRKIVKVGLDNFLKDVPETLSPDILRRMNLISLPEALRQIHFPADFEQLDRAIYRLKFQELFFLELLLAFRKQRMKLEKPGIVFEQVGEKTKAVLEKLPFELTGAQKRVLKEIRGDMRRPYVMNRLIQGDVGSGKTIVALISMLIAVENGYQAALMAPTEILAEQHYLNMHRILEGLDCRVEILLGSQTAAQRRKIHPAIASGEVDIVIGTHALIQDGVDFAKLGLAIVDEQHRFGVMQRARLREKGLNPDVMVMTATPIPRTLSLTLYGDLDVSIIDELPPGRKPVLTVWRNEIKLPEIYEFVKKQAAAGHQVYIVFPLVEESEKIDLRAASESYEKMAAETFVDFSVGLLHGRMKSDEKERVMDAFKNGDIQILVSTTVIEVGVDVPNATVMVVEHAERFGLTQLHQLRGRVGRGSEKSYCILVASPPLSDDGRKRLETMAETNDGFKISEVDLEIRGPGEFFGTRQHGLPELKMADILVDQELLQIARQEAFDLVKRDAQLLAPDVAPIRRHFQKKYQQKFELVTIG